MSNNSRLLSYWAELSPYLDELLELEPDEREPWLDQRQARLPHIVESLRAQLVQLADLNGRKFMDVAIPARLLEAGLVGQRFGAYTLERAIGQGGMGTVWLATRSDGRFEGRVAVKLLNAAFADVPSAYHLAREGRVLARLQHPNIAHLIDAGVGGNGLPYLVLEHVRGEPIDQFCASRNLEVGARIRLFLEVLGAVAHAHGHLVVHGDLKPSNILVTDDGTVKLLDFGIAALLAPAGQCATEPVCKQAPGLTPGYAAPEQLRGEALTVATDVYALGALLFRLLTGQHPGPRLGESRAEWLRALLERDAPRPSDIATDAGVRRTVRGDLDCIVAMALHRQPAERYRTVGDLAQDLRRYLTLEPVTAHPRSFTYVFRKFARRHRQAVSAAVAMSVVIALAMGITTRLMLEARYQRDQARFQSSRAEVSMDFMTQLMRLDAGQDGHPPTFHERLNLGVEILKRQYRDDPRLAGRMLVDLADYYGNEGETARANELYAQAYELGKRHDDVELMVSAQCSRAAGDAYAGIDEGNERRVQEALQLMERIPQPHITLHIGCLLAQVTFKEKAGDLVAAEAILERAMAARERDDGTTDSVPYATLLTERGAIHFLRGRTREALAATQAASDIYERNGRGRMAAGLSARFTISTILTDMGEIRRALSERDVIWQRLHEAGQTKADHVAYPVTHALLLLRMGDTVSAHRLLEGTVERARQAGNPTWLAWALLGAGQLAIREGRLEQAAALLDEARSTRTAGAGEVDARIFAEAYSAELALARPDLDAARRHRDRFLELAGHQSGQPHRALSRVLLMAARVALLEGAASDADRFAREALHRAEAKARGPDTSADVGEALLRMAQSRLMADPGADVRALLERAQRCLIQGLDADHALTREARQALASRRRLASAG